MVERRLVGRGAAPGFAEGITAVLDASPHTERMAGTPAEEALALHRAIAAAAAETDALAARTQGDAADMLAFQAAMLGDEELWAPALDAITGGTSADAAWRRALDAEISGYAASADEHFTARTADLQDIRDRVWAHLGAPVAGPVVPGGAVVVAADLPLSRFLGIDWDRGGAIVLTEGSPSSHVAMLARARGVPMVTGIGGDPGAVAGQQALVDGDAGEVVLSPGPAASAAFADRRAARAADGAAADTWRDRPAVTADGTSIEVHINLGDAAELDHLDPSCCDGIGLVRTELLFYRDDGALPDEQAQFEAYRRIAVWAEGRPVTIRLLDAGGDKPLPGITPEGESNPFLGLRGIRLLLRHPALLHTQFRALARAAVHGDVRVMLPMVTVPEELAAARRVLDAAMASLAEDAVPARLPPLGIMVEVPAAAIAIGRFDAAFFSIGSNDLTQYVTAAGRDIGAVADLADPLNPAVLELVGRVALHGRTTGRSVSLCGDAGADPLVVAHLLHAGLRSVSVAPAALGRAKQAIAATDLAAPPPALDAVIAA